MLWLDMLIAENQHLLLDEDVDNLLEEFFVRLFRQVHAGNGDTEFLRQGLRIQRQRFGLLPSLRQIG